MPHILPKANEYLSEIDGVSGDLPHKKGSLKWCRLVNDVNISRP